MRILSLSTPLFVLITPSIKAQDAPLEMIPDSAGLVIRIQAPETAVAELVQIGMFMQQLQAQVRGNACLALR